MNTSAAYDVIVVGAGSMGMSAGYYLARKGLRTLLIDAFDPPHREGSHHGEPRLIRHAYSGDPVYTELAVRAHRLWNEVEELTIPDSFEAMYEPHAGYLYSERCVEAYRQLALAQGAKLLTYAIVRDVKVHQGEGGVTVYTADDRFHAGAVLLTAGAWFSTLSPFVNLPIRAVRKVVGWFETSGPGFDAGRFPGFTLGTPEGGFYGFPNIGGAGLKIGRHDGGVPWTPGETLAPFGSRPEDEADLRRVLSAYMPKAAGRLKQGAVCKYEMSPDEDFIIDRHPEHPQVWVAGGFSGHGFKFASAIGARLADLIAEGKRDDSLRPFALDRFGQLAK
ncbi:FAD-dependent oxidoreductase [Paenibacillus barengoltzii]|uniref:FAD-dependent oxidoreductase n=1 Tax=Paenibacillus barengoltzii TaxID=343517 RepID=UPI003F8C5A56